jgi:hypothetical protein
VLVEETRKRRPADESALLAQLLGAKLFALSGASREAARRSTGVAFEILAEQALDSHLLLIVRLWQLVPPLRRRELRAFDADWESASALATQVDAGSLLWCLDNLRALRAVLDGSREATPKIADPPRDFLWPAAFDLLSGACSSLHDALFAEALYSLPRAEEATRPARELDRSGAIERGLGLLAAAGARWDEADHHFQAALEVCAEHGEARFLALNQQGYAALLLERFGDERREEALELLGHAIGTYRRLTMQSELGHAVDLLVPVLRRPGRSRLCGNHALNSFQREGDYWTIWYSGAVVRLKDAKGLCDIAQLLQRPWTETHVLDLFADLDQSASVAAATSGPSRDRRTLAQEGIQPELLRQCSSKPDAKALREYRHRLSELREELDQAEKWYEPDRAAAVREELGFIEHELASGYGIHAGQESSSPAERARKAVTKRIRTEIKRIRPLHAELARHLSQTIKTGSFCSYRPYGSEKWTVG